MPENVGDNRATFQYVLRVGNVCDNRVVSAPAAQQYLKLLALSLAGEVVGWADRECAVQDFLKILHLYGAHLPTWGSFRN